MALPSPRHCRRRVRAASPQTAAVPARRGSPRWLTADDVARAASPVAAARWRRRAASAVCCGEGRTSSRRMTGSPGDVGAVRLVVGGMRWSSMATRNRRAEIPLDSAGRPCHPESPGYPDPAMRTLDPRVLMAASPRRGGRGLALGAVLLGRGGSPADRHSVIRGDVLAPSFVTPTASGRLRRRQRRRGPRDRRVTSGDSRPTPAPPRRRHPGAAPTVTLSARATSRLQLDIAPDRCPRRRIRGTVFTLVYNV